MLEQALAAGDEQGCLACCCPWGGKFDMTEQQTELNKNIKTLKLREFMDVRF